MTCVTTCVRRQGSKYRRGRLHTGSLVLRICSRTVVSLPTRSETGQRLGFDLVLVDPTRHGRPPTGSRYFKRGQAVALAVHRKKCAYGWLVRTYQLRHVVDYKPIGIEVTSGISKRALDFSTVLASQRLRERLCHPLGGHGQLRAFRVFGQCAFPSLLLRSHRTRCASWHTEGSRSTRRTEDNLLLGSVALLRLCQFS